MTATEGKYWREWRAVCLARGWKQNADTYRHAMHQAALGFDMSHLDFRIQHWDRIFPFLRRLIDPCDLDATMQVLAFVTHDQAQDAHIPIIKPGKGRTGLTPSARLRTYPSKYERLTAVDDPGERKRKIYFISRLFQKPFIDKICRDLFERSDWEDLPMPQLVQLRDILKTRLSKWLTRMKNIRLSGSDQPSTLNPQHLLGFSIFNAETGRNFSNADIIKILLRRGVPISMGAAPKREPMEVPF